MRLFPLAALLLAGCSMTPAYVRPEAPVPATLPAYAPIEAGSRAGLSWNALITDAKLQQVIAQALANNRDLRIAAANVLAARAQVRVQRAAQLPTLAAGAAASFGNANTASGGNGATRQDYSADLGVSAFELDLFGRVRSLSEAALESWLATQEGARATRIALIAEVADAYATLAADRELLELSRQTAATAERSLALTQALNKAGLAGKLDVRQAETVVESARADVAAGQTQVAQDRNALYLLAGAPVPEALLPASLDEVAVGMQRVPAAVDSTVLLARPDVMQAEHQLKAANADVGAARAAMFPRISLTAAIGVASTALSGLFGGGSLAWSAGPAASVPIFGGPNAGNLAYSKAQRDLFLAQYEKAIQTAFREVADALARAATIDEQLRAQQALVTASAQSLSLAQQRYRAGIDPFLTTLDSQRSLYTARRSEIATRLAAVENRVLLYRVIAAETAF